MPDPVRNLFASLPAIGRLLERTATQALLERHGEAVVKDALRRAVAEARARLAAGEAEGAEVTDARIAELVAEAAKARLRPVINATGVVLHTNLGRAPLHAEAQAQVQQVAAGYSNLEVSLETGSRGARADAVEPLLCALTGAEAAFVVNNCAGATLLGLAALGAGGSAIVARGELVEIGGGFRVPDILACSGVRLIEVGTTNRTRLDDYARALDGGAPAPTLLLRVHRSNFALVGFTEEPTLVELATLARERGLPFLHDLGSGQLRGAVAPGLPTEPTAAASIAAGATLVTCSGDKLLGGPQAGILLGTREAIARCRVHPLARALRIDKLSLAALEATLRLHRDGRAHELPALAALSMTEAELSRRASLLGLKLTERGVACAIVECTGRVGGGSMPLVQLVSRAVALDPPDADALVAALRWGPVPVIARVHEGRVLLDVRCVADDALDALAEAARDALGRLGSGEFAATRGVDATLGDNEEV